MPPAFHAFSTIRLKTRRRECVLSNGRAGLTGKDISTRWRKLSSRSRALTSASRRRLPPLEAAAANPSHRRGRRATTRTAGSGNSLRRESPVDSLELAGRGSCGRRDHASRLSIWVHRSAERGSRLHGCVPPLADRVSDQRDWANPRPPSLGLERVGVLLGAAAPSSHGPPLLRHRVAGHCARAAPQSCVWLSVCRFDLSSLPSLLGHNRGGGRQHFCRAGPGECFQRCRRYGRTGRNCSGSPWNLVDAETWLLGRCFLGVGRDGKGRGVAVRSWPGYCVALGQESGPVSMVSSGGLGGCDDALRKISLRPHRQSHLSLRVELPVRSVWSVWVGHRSSTGPGDVAAGSCRRRFGLGGRARLVLVEATACISASCLRLRLFRPQLRHVPEGR